MVAQGKKQLETRVHNYKNFHPSTISTGKIFMGMKQNRILFCLDEYPCRAVVRTIAFKSEGHIHSMSSSCRTSTKEIWAAFFRQTFQAESEWFWAASSTATVQVNREKVKYNILSLIFNSWNSLYAKNENYQT